MPNFKRSLWPTVFVGALLIFGANAHAGERYAERIDLMIPLGTALETTGQSIPS